MVDHDFNRVTADAGEFKTTHWSVVLAAGRGDDARAQEALSRLCRTYWYPLYVFVRRQGHSRAALKSNRAGDAADDFAAAAAHLCQEGGQGAIAGARLATSPGPPLRLHRATEDSQNRGRYGMVDSAAVFARADIQRVVGAVLDAPVLASQLQEPGRIGLSRRQAGDDPDRLDFLPPVLEFPNTVNARDLRHVRETHLLRGYFPNRNAAPFDPPVASIHRLILRGKNPPGGSGALASGGPLGCP